jgi:ABC-2 type transport system ATP-binding protein/lipopolysaccharide transport system ATP-binding protein
MSCLAIETAELGKRYRLGQRTAQYATVREAISRGRRARGTREGRPEFWALRDVSLAVPQGEAVGVIGRNGAGKTTLLKILARITEPTVGLSRTRGRVGSLLEVGTGFHPELSGRDNVYLNGAILGMSRRDITRRFDEIVEFAAVGAFLDTPLKRYSSGMQLRLAFSVAVHLEPDIVLVDEVLAVGDLAFQQRCVARMWELGREGRTIVFVSHDLGAIRRLCSRSIWIDEGVVRADGGAARVAGDYVTHHGRAGSAVELPPSPEQPVDVAWVGLTDEAGLPLSPRPDEPFVVRARLRVREPVSDLDAAIYLLDDRGVPVLDEAWHENATAIPDVTPADELELSVTVPGVLAGGEYAVGVWVASSDEEFFRDEVLRIRLPDRLDDLRVSVAKARVVRSPTGLRIRAVERRATP